MKKFKGSKGNWNACCTGEGKKSHYVFSEDGNGGTVCAMMSNDPKDEESDYEPMAEITTREERQANSKLIASAPEMLEALMDLENDNNSIPKPIWDKVQNAIKKALG